MKHKIDMEHRMDGTKCLWHMDRIMRHFDKGERIPPVHIDMGIAKFCNVKCVFCFGLFQNPSKEYIKRKALLQTMRDAGKIGVRSIGFIGDGEPTCNPHMHEALKVGKESGVDLALSTSGVLLDTDEKRDNVLRNCVWMRFSLSAGTREGYKKIHGVDCFDKVVENAKRMVELKRQHGYKCEIGFQSVFVPTLMAEEMIEEARLAVDTGVDYFVIKQCSLPDEGQSGMMNFDLNDYDKPEIQEALQKCESMSTKQTKIIPKWILMHQKGKKPYEGCSAVPLISEISGNGDWYPCGYFFGDKKEFLKYKFGNLHEKSLKEMWESERYWKIIKYMREKFNVHAQCKGCCRLDKANEFVATYLTRPKGINFI